MFRSVLAMAVLVCLPVALAAEPRGRGDDDDDSDSGGGNSKNLHITGVVMDHDDETMWISGEDFDLRGRLGVTLGEIGDITDLCVLDAAGLPHMIHCDFSADVFPPDGDYRLTVSRGNSSKKSDSYDLTVGAVGPQGPPGADGATGPQGPPGSDGLGTFYRVLGFHEFIAWCTQGAQGPPEPTQIISGGCQCELGAVIAESRPLRTTRGNEGWLCSCVDLSTKQGESPRFVHGLCMVGGTFSSP